MNRLKILFSIVCIMCVALMLFLLVDRGSPQPIRGREYHPAGPTVWVSRWGTKYHSRWDCSNMKRPYVMTKEKAIEKGYIPCAICCPEE